MLSACRSSGWTSMKMRPDSMHVSRTVCIGHAGCVIHHIGVATPLAHVSEWCSCGLHYPSRLHRFE